MLLTLLVLGAGCRSAPTSPDVLATLEPTVRRFYTGMAADDPEANRRAMWEIVPTVEDFAALAPLHHVALWKVWAPEVEALVGNAPEHAPSYREVLPIRGVRSVDLRIEGSDALKKALDLVPADVPVRGVAIEVVKGERVAAAFLFVRERWIWIWDLERLPTLLAR